MTGAGSGARALPAPPRTRPCSRPKGSPLSTRLLLVFCFPSASKKGGVLQLDALCLPGGRTPLLEPKLFPINAWFAFYTMEVREHKAVLICGIPVRLGQTPFDNSRQASPYRPLGHPGGLRLRPEPGEPSLRGNRLPPDAHAQIHEHLHPPLHRLEHGPTDQVCPLP